MNWRSFLCFDERLSNHAQEFLRFVSVGGLGFCVDGGLLMVLMQSGWKILPARSISFVSAVTCTWLLNRLWTFRLKTTVDVRKEYASYIATQVIGAVINLAVFFALITRYPLLQNTPLIPLAMGALISLIFNYKVSKKYIFKL